MIRAPSRTGTPRGCDRGVGFGGTLTPRGSPGGLHMYLYIHIGMYCRAFPTDLIPSLHNNTRQLLVPVLHTHQHLNGFPVQRCPFTPANQITHRDSTLGRDTSSRNFQKGPRHLAQTRKIHLSTVSISQRIHIPICQVFPQILHNFPIHVGNLLPLCTKEVFKSSTPSPASSVAMGTAAGVL